MFVVQQSRILYGVPYCVYFLGVLLLPLTKVIFKKIPYRKVMQFGIKNGLKFPCGNKIYLWVFANHPAVHNGGISGGRPVGVAVGVSDMWQVTGGT